MRLDDLDELIEKRFAFSWR
jgi:hypothetical protein